MAQRACIATGESNGLHIGARAQVPAWRRCAPEKF